MLEELASLPTEFLRFTAIYLFSREIEFELDGTFCLGDEIQPSTSFYVHRPVVCWDTGFPPVPFVNLVASPDFFTA